MGVPGFFSWLIKRYPLIKHMIQKQQVPIIDYLYLDMNGIIYKCVKDDSIIFKSEVLPKEMQQIWLDIFNYINMLVNILKPNKMIVLGLDGVAPRAKMNNQRSRRFKGSRDYRKYVQQFQQFNQNNIYTGQSNQNFKHNSISPGTHFMEDLGNNLEFFIKKKIQEDDYWKNLSIIFTNSNTPGQGEHKIMEFIRANIHNFDPDDSHCLYGADADLIMLSMTLPLKNLCIIREQFVFTGQKVKIQNTRKQKIINFQMIFITILRQYFQIQYSKLKQQMKIQYNIDKIVKDFVFLFFFVGNDFLPRSLVYNIKMTSIQALIDAFKDFLKNTEEYVVGDQKLNMKALTVLTNAVAGKEGQFLDERVDQFNKFFQQKKEFDSQFNELIKQKAITQQNFLLQLKTYYQNNAFESRNIYYGKYFKINPATQITQYYNIIIQYVYGLQFVYEYYFIGLPSWQWYYPYYYAPLLSDLYFYLNHCISTNIELQKIYEGQPFLPFKQLLCILPKQSCELLPESFRKYLVDKNSILRNPIDYYPDQFQEEPYGSIRTHQYVALIPFLDLKLINMAYEKAIKDVNEIQLRRNRFKQSILYEYDQNQQSTIIQSRFLTIPNTSCTISQKRIKLQGSIRWGINCPKIKKNVNGLYKMPSLKIKEFIASVQYSNKKKYFVIELNVHYQEKFKIDQEIFYGYPLEKSGKIQAILSKNKFSFKEQFQTFSYELQDINKQFNDRKFLNDNTAKSFELIKQHILKTQRYEFDWNKLQMIIFLKSTQQFVRCLDGSYKRVYHGSQDTNYQIIPSTLASKTKVYQNTLDKVIFKNIQQQFCIGQDVIIFPQHSITKDNNKLYAQKGKVVGYKQNKIRVRLGQKIHQLDNQKLQNIVHTREIYFSLKFCSFILEIKQDVLLTLLQTINIQLLEPNLPPSIDIGLNFINRRERLLVPNLVRINFQNIDIYGKDSVNPQKYYNSLDISLKGLQLIIEYKKNFPNIFKFIEERYEKLIEKKKEIGKINWREPIKISQMYQQEQKQKALKSLMSVYLWLIKKQQTSMPLSSIYSKQISVKNIKRLQQMFKGQNTKLKKHKYGQPIIIDVDPNYLFSRRLAMLGKMHLQKIPIATTIRDQVICLKPEFFGEIGVIIGFDYNKYEVMFYKQSFGKIDLNGLCSQLWAGKFYQRDLYNFQTWPINMRNRIKTTNTAQNIGWDGLKQQINLIPKFKQKPLKQFADIQKLREKFPFTKQFLEFIETAKKNQKVEKIDPEYHIVDNKYKHYALKYDRGIPTIQKQYIQKIAKDKKYIQKPLYRQKTELLQQDIDEQIIQNKLDKDKINQLQQKYRMIQCNDGEDDATDMFN